MSDRYLIMKRKSCVFILDITLTDKKIDLVVS